MNNVLNSSVYCSSECPITLISINYDNKFYELARTIESRSNLFNKRIIEKLEIEKQYWERKGINWGIVTEEEIDKVIASNISLVHAYKEIKTIDSFIDIEASELKDLMYEFLKRIIDNLKTMRCLCKEFDDEMCLEKGSSLCIFKHLVINKIIKIDMTEKINVNKNIPIIKVVENSMEKVEAI